MQKEKNVINNKVILNWIEDLQRLSLLLINNLRGRFQIKFGMTPLLKNRGVTLIELLVVILIIGILAAIAVPQYQKAVWKSRNATLKQYVRTMFEAENLYYLNNGKYAVNFSDLDISLPLTPVRTSVDRNQAPCTLVTGGTQSILKGKDFHVMINMNSSDAANGRNDIKAYWTDGPYKCAGFMQDSARFDAKLVCTEPSNGTYTNTKGAFCNKIEKGTLIPKETAFYALP